jgi:hypothetical protein
MIAMIVPSGRALHFLHAAEHLVVLVVHHHARLDILHGAVLAGALAGAVGGVAGALLVAALVLHVGAAALAALQHAVLVGAVDALLVRIVRALAALPGLLAGLLALLACCAASGPETIIAALAAAIVNTLYFIGFSFD